MARKTFISYKYSEARELRDRIIEALGEDAQYYKGEHGFSPNRSNDRDETIWKYLKDMIWGTSVTIVILSPNMKKSDWIAKEISYSLQKVSRDGTQSQRNGVVAVVMKVNGDYSWLATTKKTEDGHLVTSYNDSIVFDIITENRYNQREKVYSCNKCKSVSRDTGSYISYIFEDEFLSDPQKYIEGAYKKSENDCAGYKLLVSNA